MHLNFRRAESAGSALSDRLVALIVANLAFDDRLEEVCCSKMAAPDVKCLF